MAHFAELNEQDGVTRVVVVSNEVLLDKGHENEAKGIDFLESLYGHRRWKQTSYSGSFRKNYAGIGYTYDRHRDAFLSPCPFVGWVLDGDTCRWVAPPST